MRVFGVAITMKCMEVSYHRLFLFTRLRGATFNLQRTGAQVQTPTHLLVHPGHALCFHELMYVAGAMKFIQDCLAVTSTERIENAAAVVNLCNTCYSYVCWSSRMLCFSACTQLSHLSNLSSVVACKVVGTSAVD